VGVDCLPTYGAAMSRDYKRRLRAPEVLVKGAEFAVVRPRPTHEDMLARESPAPWLKRPANAMMSRSAH